MGCAGSTGEDLQWDLRSPELKRAIMQKRFKHAGTIVQSGSVGNVAFTRQNRALVIEKDYDDKSCALHWAASMYGANDILSWLIQYERGFDFDINAQTKYGDTALHLAIRKNLPDAVTIIMRSERDFGEQLPCNKYGHTALHLAMAMNRVEILPLIVSEDGKWDKFNPDTVLDKWGRPAIFAGIEHDSVDSLQVLIGTFKADSQIASRPNGNVPPDDDETTTVPFVHSVRNSITSTGTPGENTIDVTPPPSVSGNGWLDESTDPNPAVRDPRLQYAQLPSKKSLRRVNPNGTEYTPNGEVGEETASSTGSLANSGSFRSQTSWADPDAAICPLNTVKEKFAPKPEIPHHPSHGTQGLEWQTPIEYAYKVDAKKCIKYLEGLKAIRYRVRRTTARDSLGNNHSSAMMKVTSTGGLASTSNSSLLPPQSIYFGGTSPKKLSPASRGDLSPPAKQVRKSSKGAWTETPVEVHDSDVSSV